MPSNYYPKGAVAQYQSASDLPLKAQPGDLALALDTGSLYEFSSSLGTWVALAGSSTDLTISNLTVNTTGGTLQSTVAIGQLSAQLLSFAANTPLTGFLLAGDSLGGSPLSCVAFVGGSTNSYSVDSSILGFINSTTTAAYGFNSGPDTDGALNPSDVMFGDYLGTSTIRLRHAGGIDVLSGKVTAVGGIGVGNSAAATTPGSVVKKIQVFDAAGVSLGYIAVYDAIS